MNRLILRYGYPLTAVILAIFAWVIYQRVSHGWNDAVVLAVSAAIVYVISVPAFLFFWPRITLSGFKRAVLKHGFGDGPIPVNTLYATPDAASSPASRGSLIATGAEDLVYFGGWLDLRDGPQVLRVPEMADRYYSIQFTDPSDGANFAYVGKRTTGTKAGDYVLTGPTWKGPVPDGMIQVSFPNHSALVLGRVFVESDSDRPAAYTLATQMQLAPLNQ